LVVIGVVVVVVVVVVVASITNVSVCIFHGPVPLTSFRVILAVRWSVVMQGDGPYMGSPVSEKGVENRDIRAFTRGSGNSLLGYTRKQMVRTS